MKTALLMGFANIEKAACISGKELFRKDANLYLYSFYIQHKNFCTSLLSYI